MLEDIQLKIGRGGGAGGGEGKAELNYGVPGGSVVKNPPASAGDACLIPGSGRSLEKEMATHSSISCLGKSMDTAAWRAAVHGTVKESDTT